MSPIRLSDLAFTIESVLDDAFAGRTVWVIAETSDIKNYPDRNYCFMTLVERDAGSSGRRETLAKLEATIWRRHYHIIQEFETATGIAFARNIQLLLRISVSYNAVYGLRLDVQQIDHSYTLGNLERERQAILDALVTNHPTLVWQQDGQYFTANQLLPRPAAWQRIALISAPGSDGLRDFKHELHHNTYGYQFEVDEYLTQIQGQGAEKAICSQLEKIRAKATAYDAVVIVRGGGSQLDFGSFDTYMLGEAVAGFPIPVVAGIGHERNVSITDMLCHSSVKTPTKAAAFLVEHNRAFEEKCLFLRDRLITASRQTMQIANEQLKADVDRLRYAAFSFLKNRNAELTEKTVTIRHLDPSNVLKRGFAIILKEGKIITQAGKLSENDTIQIRMADQTIDARVQKS
jgi:exodeoxyribonuclease VII large subunit